MTVPELIVCGSLTLDNVVTADFGLLPRSCGGNVVYAALGARLWAPRVGLVSRAGCDYPADFLDSLADLGLDLGGIARVDAPHGMNVAFTYRPDGSRVRAFPADVTARIPSAERARFIDYTTRGDTHRYATWIEFAPDAADLPAAWVAAARGVHLAAMPVQRHLTLARLLRSCRADLHVQVDSPWYDERERATDFHTGLMADIDLLLPSEADLATWRPDVAPLCAAAALARHAARPVLVKQGAAGCTLLGPDGRLVFSVPACPVDAVDPTGAGDAFCGGLLAGLLVDGDLRRAAVCGAVSASFAVEAPGPAGLLRATTFQAEQRAAQLAPRIVQHPLSES